MGHRSTFGASVSVSPETDKNMNQIALPEVEEFFRRDMDPSFCIHARSIAESLLHHDWKLIRAAIRGDADAAENLIWSSPNEMRGWNALSLWHAGTSAEALRAALRAAWGHDPGHVKHAFGRWLPHALKAAAFDTSHLPERIRVYRGVAGVGLSRARNGSSWTTDRDVACWFATRYRQLDDESRPTLVITTVVPRRRVLMTDDGRREAEVFLWRGARGALIDPDRDTWKEAGTRFEATKRSRTTAALPWQHI
jgi:hypothetical protein